MTKVICAALYFILPITSCWQSRYLLHVYINIYVHIDEEMKIFLIFAIFAYVMLKNWNIKSSICCEGNCRKHSSFPTKILQRISFFLPSFIKKPELASAQWFHFNLRIDIKICACRIKGNVKKGSQFAPTNLLIRLLGN